jgi:hypothetical protein
LPKKYLSEELCGKISCEECSSEVTPPEKQFLSEKELPREEFLGEKIS